MPELTESSYHLSTHEHRRVHNDPDLDRYFQLRARPGDVDPMELIELGVNIARKNNNRDKGYTRFVGGNVLAEAVVTRGLQGDYSDYDTMLEVLDYVNALYTDSVTEYQYQYAEGNKGALPALTSVESHRLFLPLYKDIYHNEIQDTTRIELWENLQLYCAKFAQQLNEASASLKPNLLGKHSEMLILSILNYPYGENNGVVIPSWEHNDSMYSPGLTHDGVYFDLDAQHTPSSDRTRLVEVKTNVKPSDQFKSRNRILVDTEWILGISGKGKDLQERQDLRQLVTEIIMQPEVGNNEALICEWQNRILAGETRWTYLLEALNNRVPDADKVVKAAIAEHGTGAINDLLTSDPRQAKALAQWSRYIFADNQAA